MTKSSAADVKESIAGYYYQFLIATQELVDLYINDQKGFVAIEKGADIRVQNDQELYVEAKFYGKDKFSKKDEAITRTIYNFAIQYKSKLSMGADVDNLKFQFRTNISIDDLAFFRSWKNETKDEDEIIRYIQYCLIKESKLLECKTTSFEKINEVIEAGQIKDNIKKEAFLSESEILNYTKKVEFNSSLKREIKEFAIKEIVNDIEQKLMSKLEIDHETAQKSRNVIIEHFFDTTVSNSDSYIPGTIIGEVANNDELYKLKYLEEKQIQEDIKKIEEIIEGYQEYAEVIGIPDSDRIKILADLQKNFAYLIESFPSAGYKNKKGEYILSETNYDIALIMELLQPFSEFVVKTNNRYGDTKLTNLKGINNLGFSEHEDEYLIKSGANTYVNRASNIIFKKFFEDIVSNYSVQELDHTEAVYFNSNSIQKGAKPCEVNKSSLLEMIPDITDPNPVYLQTMFIAQDYRCTHCIEYTENCCRYSTKLEKEQD